MTGQKLLGEIAVVLKTPYLSDLHLVSPPRLLEAVRELGLENYSLQEWDYSLSYILGRNVRLESVKEIETFLQNTRPQSS